MVRALTQAGYSLPDNILGGLLESGSRDVISALVDNGSFRKLPAVYFRSASKRSDILVMLLKAGLVTPETHELCEEWIASVRNTEYGTLESLLKGGISCSSRVDEARAGALDSHNDVLDTLRYALDIGPLKQPESGVSFAYSAARVDSCHIDVTQIENLAKTTYRIDLANVGIADASELADIVQNFPDSLAASVTVKARTESVISKREGSRALDTLEIYTPSKKDAEELARAFNGAIAGCKVLQLIGGSPPRN
jgi:hypothetical protein